MHRIAVIAVAGALLALGLTTSSHATGGSGGSQPSLSAQAAQANFVPSKIPLPRACAAARLNDEHSVFGPWVNPDGHPRVDTYSRSCMVGLLRYGLWRYTRLSYPLFTGDGKKHTMLSFRHTRQYREPETIQQ